ncbi:dolichyl-P-Man:GDP-Man5GlcNAc2-PP-dolichyl alpha-1,2-mannosyltransferase, putative [Trypanosoma cruzi marinkellei]|uniref:Mannosyltransferase n=1 Tax=Trypanosoma cruzi marinkellei TaxID=85056 RepID=K2NNN2_TRYCR|nr:dolichyl-P-Man:GDP-Man5GlcNAc2-PP-dolichyl alpha-1,2-mannosyltransferase, putative [Trypanosoma cruzi marinkellei]
MSGMPDPRSVDVYFFNRIFHGRMACLSELFLVYSVWKAISRRAAVVTLALLLFNYPIPHAAVSALPTSFTMINYFMALGCWLHSGHRSGREKNIPAVTVTGRHAGTSRRGRSESHYFSIFGTVFFAVFACAVVWPFAGFAVLPMALDLIVRHPKASVVSLLLSLALIIPLAVGLDTFYYCRVTWSAWNLVRYNLKGGAELYGVEPWYYFIKNLLLNAHVLFLAGVLAPCVIIFRPTLNCSLRYTRDSTKHDPSSRNYKEKGGTREATVTILRKRTALPRPFFSSFSLVDLKAYMASVPSVLSSSSSSVSPSRSRMLLYISPFFVWFTFWLTVAHKEERFMAPVYPFLLLAAALSFTLVFFPSGSASGMKVGTKAAPAPSVKTTDQDLNEKMGRHVFARRGTLPRKSWLLPVTGCILLLFCGVLSLSRSMAVYHFYAGPQRLMYDTYDVVQRAAAYKIASQKGGNNMTSSDEIYTVCVGREWYRFPSSFFLDTQMARVAFIKTDGFSGALPLPFKRDDSYATCRCGAAGVNDLNQEIAEQYVSDAAVECDAILDSHSAYDSNDLKNSPRNVFTYPLVATAKPQQYRLLDVDKTPMWCRVLYYPFGISERCAVWRHVELLSKHRLPANT